MEPTIVSGALGDNPPKAHLYYGLNVLDALRLLPDNSVNMVCTSPPYWGLRNYGVDPQVWGGDAKCDHEWGDEIQKKGQTGDTNASSSTLGDASWGNGVCDEGILRSQKRQQAESSSSAFCSKCNAWRGCLGLEPNPDLFVEHLVLIGREIRRVLHPTGTFWLNLGDSYMSHSASPGAQVGGFEGERQNHEDGFREAAVIGKPHSIEGLKDKDLVGVPWRAALALQADGWWLRNDIIWHKCLGGGTYLYARTSKGEGPIQLKDLARQSPSTVKLWTGSHWSRVVRWEKVKAQGLEFEFRSGEKITCTPEHRWPTARGLLEARDLIVGDEVSTTQITCSRPSQGDEDWAWLVGLFIRGGDWNESSDSFQINSYDPSCTKRATEILTREGGVCEVRPQKDGSTDILVRDLTLAHRLSGFVAGASPATRHVSSRVWEQRNHFLRALVEGYLGDFPLDGEGNRYRVYASSLNMVRDLRALATRLGAQVFLKKQTQLFRGEWVWQRRGQPHEVSSSEIVGIRKAADKVFYDVEIEDRPHLFTTASGMLTHNSNSMPSSVQDRFSCKYEHVFLLAKNSRYFFDLEAVKVPLTYGTYQTDGTFTPAQNWFEKGEGHRKIDQTEGQLGTLAGSPRRVGRGLFSDSGKNPGDLWTLATGGYKGAHFAVWPEKLVEPMVKAGSSEIGRCPTCKTPWRRVVQKQKIPDRPGRVQGRTGDSLVEAHGSDKREGNRYSLSTRTVGWGPSCSCPEHEPERCVVLDIFSGSATTGAVALRLGRDYIGLDLNHKYLPLAEARLEGRKAPSSAGPDEVDLIGALFGSED